MTDNQMSIFDFAEKFKIDKPIRLTELFAGYGSQSLALKYLGVPFESYKCCEWEVNAIKAYKALHFGNDTTDYSADKRKSELVEILAELGISNDGKVPMDKKSIARKGESWLRETYNNIKATHNLVDITKAKGKDLAFSKEFCDIMFYSFPCQSLSLAGKQEGMDKGSGTRSGLLWEVERILNECNTLPKILVMENVTQVHGTKNKHNFDEWCKFLESKGYKSFWKDLNGKYYCIPQNRDRTFMVSILNFDGGYSFPKQQVLRYKLKDILEQNVDEKYYISNAMVDYYTKHNNRVIAPTILQENEIFDAYNKTTRTDGICGTITANGNTSSTHCGTFFVSNSNNYRIRKLTPTECLRLMAVKDTDIEKLKNAGLSNSALYKLAGNSIITTCLMGIFGQMIGDCDWQTKIYELGRNKRQ